MRLQGGNRRRDIRRLGLGLARLAGFASVLLLIGASSASAAIFCVQKPAPACTPSDGVNHTTLQAAMDAADNEGMFPGKDRIEIGAVNLTAGGANTNPVELVGAGSGAGGTSISGALSPVLNIAGDSSTVQDLGVTVGDNQTGLQLSGTATNIRVVGTSTTANGETGVALAGGAAAPRTLSDSDVEMATTPGSGSVGVLAGGSLVERTDVTGEIGIFGRATARRTEIAASATGVGLLLAFGGTTTLDQVTIRMLTPAATSEAMDATGATLGAPPSIIARHVTAVGPGNSTVGVRAVAGCDLGQSVPASVTLENTILREFGVDILRQGVDDCGGAVPSPANVTAEYSIFDPGKVNQSGAGTLDQPGMTNLNVDPLFTGPGDFHLLPGSPAIDAGDPDSIPAGQSNVDLDGNPRVADGDGNGSARRDIGAFEVQPVPPSPPAPPATTSAPTGQRAAALKRCKKKFSKGPKRKKCIRRAKKLPI